MRWLATWFVLLVSFPAPAQTARVWFDTEAEEETGWLKAWMWHDAAQPLVVSWKLTMQQAGEEASVYEGGPVQVNPQVETLLAQTWLSLDDDLPWWYQFEVFLDGALLAVIHYPEGQAQPWPVVPKAPPPPSGYSAEQEAGEIDGLVFDRTRSPLGRKFYADFFKAWEAPEGVHGFFITITEKPAPGGSSFILIQVNKREVWQVQLPRQPQLVSQYAEMGVGIVQQYLQGQFQNDQLLSY